MLGTVNQGDSERAYFGPCMCCVNGGSSKDDDNFQSAAINNEGGEPGQFNMPEMCPKCQNRAKYLTEQ